MGYWVTFAALLFRVFVFALRIGYQSAAICGQVTEKKITNVAILRLWTAMEVLFNNIIFTILPAVYFYYYNSSRGGGVFIVVFSVLTVASFFAELPLLILTLSLTKKVINCSDSPFPAQV